MPWPGKRMESAHSVCHDIHTIHQRKESRGMGSTGPQKNYDAVFCANGGRKGRREECAFQLQEIPPPNCSTCQATGIASMNKRNTLCVQQSCKAFSSVLFLVPHPLNCWKKNASWNGVDFPKQVFSSPVQIVPSPSQERQLLCSQKTKVGSGKSFFCVFS